MTTADQALQFLREWFDERNFVLEVRREGDEYAAYLRHVSAKDPTGRRYATAPTELLAAFVAEQRFRAEQEGGGGAPGDTYLEKAEERLRRMGLG
jgi:hypothetical protein